MQRRDVIKYARVSVCRQYTDDRGSRLPSLALFVVPIRPRGADGIPSALVVVVVSIGIKPDW